MAAGGFLEIFFTGNSPVFLKSSSPEILKMINFFTGFSYLPAARPERYPLSYQR